MTEKKNSKIVKYLNMDYEAFVKDISDSSKIYFPNYSNDTSKASSAQMMIEQAAYVGDVLAFYLEDRFRNTNNVTATDINSIVYNSRHIGYKFNGPASARGTTNFYLVVPATTGSAGDWRPDMRYALKLKNVKLQNTNGITFEALEDVDFTNINISSSLYVKLYKTTSNGQPQKYILKTTAEVMAAKTVTETFSLGDYKAKRKLTLSEKNVLEILSIKDSSGESWYEVDYLAQEAVFESVKNISSDNLHIPYILKMKTVPRRFITETDPKTGTTSLIFGPGKAVEIGDSFVPDPSDLALDIKGKSNFVSPSVDPQNFLKTRTLGLSPYNTTLTVKYRVGGGRVTNTARGGLRDIISKEIEYNSVNLDSTLLNETLTSLSSENTERIVGGREAETIDEIKHNSSANFATQNRIVTREDFIARALSMPNKYGRIFRCYATYRGGENSGVQLHVLAKNELNQLIIPTNNLKVNLKNYIRNTCMLNQGIDILNGKIINIALEYSILVKPGYNKVKTKIDTLNTLKKYFDVNNWQIGQPIVLDEIRCMIIDTEGVLSVTELNVVNRNNTVNEVSYSSEVFDVKLNTKNGIVFCPSDSIFELKYPEGQDLKVAAL